MLDMLDMLAGPWHHLVIGVDTAINAEGEERPCYAFDLECPPECKERGECFLREHYLPLESQEIPGVGLYRVRVDAVGALEFEAR